MNDVGGIRDESDTDSYWGDSDDSVSSDESDGELNWADDDLSCEDNESVSSASSSTDGDANELLLQNYVRHDATGECCNFCDAPADCKYVRRGIEGEGACVCGGIGCHEELLLLVDEQYSGERILLVSLLHVLC